MHNQKEYNKQYRKKNKKKLARIAHEYWVKNKARITSKKRLKTYGISTAQVELLIAKQNNTCAICWRPFDDTKTTHIDHDHITGKVRGILCPTCNLMLGCSGDSPDILDRAIKYLYEHKNVVEKEAQNP